MMQGMRRRIRSEQEESQAKARETSKQEEVELKRK